MIALIAATSLVLAGPLKQGVSAEVSETGPTQSEASEASAPESRQSCPSAFQSMGSISSKHNEVIRMHPETEIVVQHKLDIDAHEDRCINAVLIRHKPERGCAYQLMFNAVRGSHKLELTGVELDADSWCPGWDDRRETGEHNSHRSYELSVGFEAPSLTLSRSHVPDRTADRSCTQLTMTTQGGVYLSQGIASRPELFNFDRLQFSGQFDSFGEPSSICPAPPPVVVEVEPEPEGPKINPLKNTSVLVYLGHEPVPNFPVIDGGIGVMQEIGNRFTLRADVSLGPLKHSALNANLMFGSISAEPGLRPYLGLRTGSLRIHPDTDRDKTSAMGLNIGLETNRLARKSPFYAAFEVTPVLYGEELRGYMGEENLYTSVGVMGKLHVGVSLR